MIKIYNTLTGEKELLEISEKERINLFVCGPTVYDYSHLGHARTYVLFDAFVKYLRSKQYEVFYLQNITDIDDKIIARARENKEDSFSVSEKFLEEYFRDMSFLKVDSVSEYAKATEYIKEIISQTKRLLEKDYAYQGKDGIYYDISKFKDYGKLSKRTTQQAEDGTSRIDESVQKKNRGDFCVWKFSKKDEPSWDSPWGKGRPGWHIEDTAIAESFFGPQYDLHGGGRDLIFPHHEAEIAIMEAVSGKAPFVRYWMHAGFLTVDGEKMSKSLGNFITIRDFFKNHSPRLLRFLALKSHYRSPVDYNEGNIDQTYQELKKIDQLVNETEKEEKDNSSPKTEEIITRHKEKIDKALLDDFNTPVAIATLFSFITEVNSKTGDVNREKIKKFLEELDSVFSFIVVPVEERLVRHIETDRAIRYDIIPDKIRDLVKQREDARNSKNFEKADSMRKKIEEKGYLVEDTKDGFNIKKI